MVDSVHGRPKFKSRLNMKKLNYLSVSYDIKKKPKKRFGGFKGRIMWTSTFKN